MANTKEVLMAFSQEIPPYIFQKENKGIELEIIAKALAYKGHTLKPAYYPLGRVPIAFTSKVVDAAMGDMGINLTSKGGFYAEPAVIYDNVFITLKSRNISIKKPSDLDLLLVASFQGAEKRYDTWLKKVVDENRFFGVSDQLKQVELLSLGRFDVVLSDRFIFQHFVKQLELIGNKEGIEVDEHHFITVNPKDYRPVFRDKKIRDDFNAGLRKLKESGDYEKIYDNYMN
jgi:polar amino acid transport system substrate-binding protein